MTRKLTAVIIGAGDRGQTYARQMCAMPDHFQIVAVAEPKESRRNAIRDMFSIPEDRCFHNWEDLLSLGKIADIAVIATMDRLHFLPACAAIRAHYDILLEKPVSPDPRECEKMAQLAEAEGVKVLVCHVLRYTPFFTSIKKLIANGDLGDIISINHEECVENIHQSHSFVRGNWGNSQRSSFMLLQKSCHDLDILQWLIGKPCKKIQSFGALTHFVSNNAPEGAPERCIDNCPHQDTCAYNAVTLYLKSTSLWRRSACTGLVAPTDEDVEQALRTNQYGKCVYKCDNDVVDHQTVNMLFDGNTTATFTMCAFNKGGRFIHIMGTKGELWGSMDSQELPLRVFNFETRKTTEYPVSGKDGLVNGHGGGDQGIIKALHAHLCGNYEGFSVSDLRTSVDNHHLVFAAEESRLTGRVVDMAEYIASLSK